MYREAVLIDLLLLLAPQFDVVLLVPASLAELRVLAAIAGAVLGRPYGTSFDHLDEWLENRDTSRDDD